MIANRKTRIAAIFLTLGAIVAFGASSAAAATSVSKGKSCEQGATLLSAGSEPRTPVALGEGLDPGTIARFAVLRRAASPADQVPPVNPLASELSFELAGYYPTYLRQLAALPDGTRYMLIPGLRIASAVPPAPCLPPSLRRQRPKLVEEQAKRASAPSYCVAVLGPRLPVFSAQAHCQSFSEVESGASLVEGDGATQPIVDIVPDGVAALRIAYRDGTSATATVTENAFVFTPPQGPIRREMAAFKRLRAVRVLEQGKHLSKRHSEELLRTIIRYIAQIETRLAPTKVQWLDGAGNVIRAFKPRTGASVGLLSVAESAPVGGFSITPG